MTKHHRWIIIHYNVTSSGDCDVSKSSIVSSSVSVPSGATSVGSVASPPKLSIKALAYCNAPMFVVVDYELHQVVLPTEYLVLSTELLF